MADESAYYDKLSELQAFHPDAASAMEAQRTAGPKPKQAPQQPQQPAPRRKQASSRTIIGKNKKRRV